MEHYREVKRPAKVGEKIKALITYQHCFEKSPRYKEGDILTVTRLCEGNPWGGIAVCYNDSNFIIQNSEYVVLEPITLNPADYTAEERQQIVKEFSEYKEKWQPWQPKKDNRYFGLDINAVTITSYDCTSSVGDDKPLALRTKEAAESAIPDIRLAIRLAQWREDRGVKDEGNYWVYYCIGELNWYTSYRSNSSDNIGRFPTEQLAQQFIDDNKDFLDEYVAAKGWAK